MQVILTGDRPTGALHLGHYIGSLKNRVLMQDDNKLFVIIANTQALSDYFDQPWLVQNNILQLMEDYISVGINPEKTCVFVQSEVKALFEMTYYFMNLVTLSRLQRNPTIKDELKNKKFADNILAGFLCYPVSQAADILAFNADLVPVGVDQLPMIEQTNEIAAKFNNTYKCNVFKQCKALIGTTGKLLGIDGKSKASKSLNNAIFLNDSDEELKKKINAMYTDPMHIKITDAGNVENHMVFHYLDVFYDNKEHLEELKKAYKSPGVSLGDMYLKNLLYDVLKDFLLPIREKRSKIDKKNLLQILHEHNKKANIVTNEKLKEIHDIFYKNLI